MTQSNYLILILLFACLFALLYSFPRVDQPLRTSSFVLLAWVLILHLVSSGKILP